MCYLFTVRRVNDDNTDPGLCIVCFVNTLSAVLTSASSRFENFPLVNVLPKI